jgi:hypothetical protein
MKEQTKSNYQLLIEKLDRFIRKYYINQLIRGSLYWIALSLVFFLLFNLLEYNYYFEKGVRKVFFFSFIAISLGSFMYWIFTPLLHYFRLGKVISHEQAAQIIGEHFFNVKDKLLNVLQLKRLADSSISPDLVFAGINQKTKEIHPVPFRKAIDFKQNRRYLRYALPPLLILLGFLVAAPSIIKDSTSRILKNNVSFEREAPFRFLLDPGQQLSVVQYEDFELKVSVEGSVLPNEAFIDIDNYNYRLKKDANNSFSYRIKNVHKDVQFRIYSGEVSTDDYALSVIKKPNIVSFDIRLDYPGYTGRRDETLSNIGDLVVPTGTAISWNFETTNTDHISMRFSSEGEEIDTDRKGVDLFSINKRVKKDQFYSMIMSNKDLPRSDSIQYTINVIPDLYPTISVEKFEDSTDQKLLFFVGNASDDYGIKSLNFNYKITEKDGRENNVQSFPLSLKRKRQFQYDYIFDIKDLNLKPGQELNFYFEVFDNDAINGSKSSRTGIMQYRMPTVEEFEEQEEENSEEIKKELENSMKESRKLQEEMRELREKLFQEKSLEWQNKKEIENMIERQKELQEKLNEAKEKFNENLQNQEEFSNPNEEVQEKQEKLQELFEDLMSEEMQELMKQFEELLNEMEKNDALEKMEDFEFNSEELEMELDRLLELFKQLELENELQKEIEKLEELAAEEEKLSEETKNESKSNEQLEEEQEELNKKFDEIQKDMEGIKQKNSELERPKDLDQSDQQMEKIDQDMQNSMEQLQKQENKKASDSQKNAAQRMRDMAESMAAQMMQGQMEQMQEDMQTLRQLLENLVTLSFDQEDLIEYFGTTNVTTPRYVNLVQDQFKIKDDFKVVEDSLQALSKRVFQIESFITEKVSEVKENMRSSLKELEERKKVPAAGHQQSTMKNLNDLALMLSEVMNQMQQQMAAMMPGQQMCTSPKGPGSGEGVPLDKITEGQKKLSEEMQKMLEGRQQGKEGSSKEFAQMAARQAALRKALREIKQQKEEQGKGDGTLDQIIEEMDKVETDLVNKRLTNAMKKRQEEILTRLLEAENAERQREYDNKRKSQTAQETERRMPPSLEEYIKQREAEIELFNAASPALKPYYKFLVEEYYNALKEQ